MPNFEKLNSEDELKNLYEEDQGDRTEKLWEKDAELMQERDETRLRRVLELIEKGQLKTSADYFHAAMILQHGSETRHYELAHEFAKRAADEGYVEQEGEVDPLWLAAAARDRALMSQGKPQLYGTQFRTDSPGGLWYLYEMDPSVTDEERARFHVPPLAQARKRVEDMNRKIQDREKEE